MTRGCDGKARRYWGALLLLAAALLARPATAETVTVFAAASLTDAMKAAGRAYEDRSGDTVRFSFAASSRLARQIAAGAPADIYAAANRQWMDYLAKESLVDVESRISPIANSLVLIAPAERGPEAIDPADGAAIRRALGPDGRLALGDPAHVPAGIYAEQALRSLGLWADLKPRLAQTDDVRAALALVARGEAPLGIVYRTDARISDAVRILGSFPADSHKPIRYPFAIVAGRDRPAVQRLFDFMTSKPALAIFREHGFATPGAGH